MVKVFELKKKRLFGEDADWVPSKGIVFTSKKSEEKPAPEVPEVPPRESKGTEAKGASPIPEVPEKTRDLSFALANTPITDKEGLERAYEQHDAYTYGDTLHIAGTQFHTAQDVWDDATKVPFRGDVQDAEKYKAAEKALKTSPNIKRVVGRSLGGSLALELQKKLTRG